MAVSSLVPAATGPTLAEIQTAVATYAPSPNNWTLISTWTVGGVSSFTWSGLSGYKTYKIVTPGLNCGNSSVLMTINSDTANNYIISGGTPTQSVVNIGTRFVLANPASTPFHFNAVIENANNSGNKSIEIEYGDISANPGLRLRGSYGTNQPISSITIFNANNNNFSASNASANLVHLYGAN